VHSHRPSQRVGRECQHEVPRVAAVEAAAKKKMLHDSPRDTPRVKRLRQEFNTEIRETVSDLLGHLTFVDEGGGHLGLTRLWGRAAPGQRVVEATPGYAGPHYTVVAALGLQGICAPWVFQGATSGVAFETYVEPVLGPALHAGDLGFIDNLSAHTRDSIRQLIEGCGARLHFVPPYSPDWNPIELCWAKVKTALRAAQARTFEDLVAALCDALRAINPTDVLAWFAHCGYAVKT
jgi:transposase